LPNRLTYQLAVLVTRNLANSIDIALLKKAS
jgi:hypothetical protein